jgi:hypothetical protein
LKEGRIFPGTFWKTGGSFVLISEQGYFTRKDFASFYTLSIAKDLRQSAALWTVGFLNALCSKLLLKTHEDPVKNKGLAILLCASLQILGGTTFAQQLDPAHAKLVDQRKEIARQYLAAAGIEPPEQLDLIHLPQLRAKFEKVLGPATTAFTRSQNWE